MLRFTLNSRTSSSNGSTSKNAIKVLSLESWAKAAEDQETRTETGKILTTIDREMTASPVCQNMR